MMESDAELLEEDAYRWSFERRRCKKGQIFRHVEGSVKIWKRFALLPNINLQKYTLGNSFTSEELQGELIFWWGGEYDNDNAMCEIVVRDNRYWITPLEENRIQINDTKIEVETEIRFGDFLVLGEMHSESDSAARYPNVLLFTKRELNPEMFLKTLTEEESSNLEEEDQHGVPLPIIQRAVPVPDQEQEAYDQQYILVLCKTLAYLPIPTVKQLRLLSKLLNEAAMTVLGDKCQANFQLNNPWGRRRIRRWDQSNDAMAFFRYKWEMSTSSSSTSTSSPSPNLLPHWKISLPVFNSDDDEDEYLDCSEGTPGAKLVSDLSRFLPEGHGHHVTCLVLEGDIFSETDFRVRYNILRGLQSTLKQLTISGDWAVEEDSQLVTFPGDIHFRNLEHFTLSTHGSREAYFSLWVESMMRRSPTNPLRTCPVINEVVSLAILLPQENTTVTPILLNALTSSFPNLVEITLRHSTPLVMRLLWGIRQPLKKLDLNLVTDVKSLNDVMDFKGLLDKHAETLESLRFILQRFYDFHNDEIPIRLPILPKLKGLMVGVTGDGNGEESTRMVLTFDLEDRIDYGLHLPKLESLTLKATRYLGYMNDTEEERARKRRSIRAFWMEYASFFNSFFPPRTPYQVVRSLKVLDIPFEDREHVLFPRAPEIAAMFPNVCNQWANQGRVTRTPDLTLEQRRDEGDVNAAPRCLQSGPTDV